MTQEKKVQTAMVMDVRQVKEALQDVVKTTGKAAEDIIRSGKAAGEGMDAIPEGLKKSEKQVETATKSISDSIRRMTRNAQRELAGLSASGAGGAGSAAALQYETLIKGADLGKLQPQIAAYGELKATIDSLKAAQQEALAGTEVLNRIRERTAALQAQANAAKMTEADLLALKAAERGVAQQADPLIAKLRESAAAADEAAAAARRKGEADRFIAGINAQASAIGKTRADLLELQAAQLGVAKEAAPMIRAIREADGQLMGMGRSAKEMQWAMRGLPAQFTDIWVSLASGQSPMTVFIQQGGQLKDMFGGIGPAARAMGTFIAGLISPFTLVAAAAGVMAIAYKAGTDEITKLSQASIIAGQQLGISASGLRDVAESAARLGKSTFGAAAEFIGQVAATSRIAKEDLTRFTATILRMEAVGGPAAKDMAKALADLGKDPVQASAKLTEQYNYLTAATYNQIKALGDQGKKTEAAALAQRTFFDAMADRTPQMLASLGLIDRAWLTVKQSIGEAWSAVKQFGAGNDVAAEIAATEQRIARLRAVVQNTGIAKPFEVIKALRGQSFEEQLAAEEKLLAQQKASLKTSEFLAQQDARRAELTAENAKWQSEAASYASKQKQEQLEINSAKVRGQKLIEAGLLTEKELNERIAAIRKKYGDKDPDRFKAAEDAAKSYMAALSDLQKFTLAEAASAEQLSKSQAKLREIQASPAWADYSRQQREQIIYAASLAQTEEDRAIAHKKWLDTVKTSESEYKKLLDAMENSAESAEKQLAALEVENRARVLSIATGIDLKEAIDRITIARLEERRVVLAAAGNDAAVEMIDREIEARKKLAVELRRASIYDAEKKRAEALVKEYEKLSDTITDALMRGFENGKDFARNFRDTLVNMFKTLVLRPIIQAVVNPVAMAITGGLGIGGGASAATNIVAQQAGGGAGGVAQSLGTLYSSINGAFKSVGTSVALAADRIGEWLVLNTKGSLNKAGGTLMQYAGQIGNFAQGAFAAVSNLGIKQMVAGDYRIGSGFNKVQDIGVAITSMINPALGAVVAAVSGIVNRAFGRAPKTISETGIEGTFMAGDATGEAFQNWVKKGGWFRSNKYGTDRTALDAELSAALDAGGLAVLRQTEAWAKALQLPAEYLTQVTTSFRVKLTGDAEKDKAAIAQVIQNYGVSLASIYKDVLQPLQREGENLADTLGRVSILESFSRNLNQLGGVFSRVANLGIDVRESFIAMAGGMDELMKNALGFAQNYYSREEIAGLRANEILQALMSAGIGAAGDIGGSESRQEFRRLVESVDVSTETGRQQLATLLSVQGAFTDVADYLAETGATLAQAATQAPEAGPLTSLISPLQQQTDATNSLTGGMTNLRTSIERLIETMRQQVAAAMPAAAPAPAFAGWPSEVIDYSNPGGA